MAGSVRAVGCVRFKAVKCYYVTDHIVLYKRQILYLLSTIQISSSGKSACCLKPESQLSFWEFLFLVSLKGKDCKCEFSIVVFMSFFFFSICFSAEHSETKERWWLSGADRWIQTYMEGLPVCLSVCLMSLCLTTHAQFNSSLKSCIVHVEQVLSHLVAQSQH